MKKISLAIIEKDEEYLKALSNYLSSNHFKEFSITAISDEEYFNQFLETVKGIDIVLINENLYDQRLEQKFISKILLLGENKKRENENENYIYKYQIASSIYKKIKNSYLDSNIGNAKYDDYLEKTTQITSFYSPIGGIGKTTVAIATAIKLSEKSRNVLYMNFEDIPSVEAFFECNDSTSMSEILYLAKDRSKLLTNKILENILTDSSGVCYFNPINSVLDYETINRDDLIYLMDQIKKLNKFDNIIIDMGSKFSSLYGVLFMISDSVIGILGNDKISEVKMNNFLMQQESIDKYTFIINKYDGSNISIPDQIQKFNKSIVVSINYYKEIDANIKGTQLFTENNQFTFCINELIQKVFME